MIASDFMDIHKHCSISRITKKMCKPYLTSLQKFLLNWIQLFNTDEEKRWEQNAERCSKSLLPAIIFLEVTHSQLALVILLLFTVVVKHLKISEHKWYKTIVFILWPLGFKWTEHWLFHTLKCKNLQIHVYSRHNLDENIARWCRERHSCTHMGGTIKLGNKYTSAMLYRRNDGNFRKLFLAICCGCSPVITQ